MGRPLAEWWERLLAILIDAVIFFVVEAIVGVIAAAVFITTAVGSGGSRFSLLGSGLDLVGELVVAVVLAGVALGYFAVLDGGAKGQTVSKMALGIATRDAATGGPIGPGRAVLRRVVIFPNLALDIIPVIGRIFGFISLVWVLICALSPLWNSGRQGYHDQVAKTVVVKVK